MERTVDRFFLQRGQTLHLHADQAASIVIASGRLSVTQSRHWLGEQFPTPVTVLAEGQAHAVGSGGWISVTALATAEIIAFPRRHRRPAWLDVPLRLAQALGGWRRRLSNRRA